MDLLNLLKKRESIRSYDENRPLEKDVLNYILEAGCLAPSACNLQPWEFIVVSSIDGLAKVRPAYHREWFKKAPHILIVKGSLDNCWVRVQDGSKSLETDLTIAMDHMILAAESQGVATCWIEAYDPAVLAEALDLKENERVFSITPLGYPEKGFVKNGNKIRKELSEIVRYL